MAASLWVFGYGSLVWRPSFAFVQRVVARLPGMTRRFWQGSEDHRGVPGSPGRVVTLIEAPLEACWGVAYEVHPDACGAVVAALDHREQGGYDRSLRLVFDRSGAPVAEALVYVATADNPCFLGDAPLEDMARQIVEAVGPSGPNAEYVLRLDDALRALDVDDDHVRRLAAAVRSLAPDAC